MERTQPVLSGTARQWLPASCRTILEAISARLSRQAYRVSPAMLKLLLSAGVLFSVSCFVLVAMHAWQGGNLNGVNVSNGFQRTPQYSPVGRIDTGAGYQEQQRIDAGAILGRLDSLQETPGGKIALDSIRKYRPALLDSAALLIKLFRTDK